MGVIVKREMIPLNYKNVPMTGQNYDKPMTDDDIPVKILGKIILVKKAFIKEVL